MAIRKIAQIGHPVLRSPAEPVATDQLRSKAIQSLIEDLIETMRDANGAGIAAPQIYEPVQICAVEVNNNPRYPYKPKVPLTVLVNPRIEPLSTDRFDNYEGCLSVPNLRGIVKRWGLIRLTALDRHGESIDQVCRGFTAGTMQHEVDHLNGIIFVDRVEEPRTLCTWNEFERHHREAFLVKAQEIIARFGS